MKIPKIRTLGLKSACFAFAAYVNGPIFQLQVNEKILLGKQLEWATKHDELSSSLSLPSELGWMQISKHILIIYL